MSILRLKTRRLLASVGFLLLAFSLSGLSWASGYTIGWDNLNSGILPESSDVHIVMSSVGQQVTGSMSGGNYILVGGFWTGYYASGDANGDGTVGPGDIVYLINYLFRNGPPPDPYETGDVNCDHVVDAGDVVHLINYLFRNGAPPLHCDP